MQGNYYSYNTEYPVVRYIAVMLVLLVVAIVYLAVTARPATVRPPLPAQTTGQAGVAEHLLTLTDGRSVLCLTFPDRGMSCDWARAQLG